MAYTVRYGKLYFEPRQGNGPCSRRQVGQDYRRHIRLAGMAEGTSFHATKGRIFKDEHRVGGKKDPDGVPAMVLPDLSKGLGVADEPDAAQSDRARRNSPAYYGGVAGTASAEKMTRQRHRRLRRVQAKAEISAHFARLRRERAGA